VPCFLVGKILSGITFLCIPTSLLKAFHTTDVVIQCQSSWSSYAAFITQIYSTILECSVPHRNLFPNHHVLPLDSNKFSLNWVCVFTSCMQELNHIFHLHAGITFHSHRDCHCFTHMFTILTDIRPFQPAYLLWSYIHATKRCSSGCYNRHSYYLMFWCNIDTGHSFSQAAFTCTLLLERPSYTHILFGMKVLVVSETKEDKFWYAALLFFWTYNKQVIFLFSESATYWFLQMHTLQIGGYTANKFYSTKVKNLIPIQEAKSH